MRRVIILFFLIIINFILQTSIMGQYSASGITPNLLLILTMSFGLMRGRREGLLVGASCGLLVDLFFSSVVGAYMFLYMIIGYINGFFHKNYLIEDVLLPVIVITIDELFFDFVVYITMFLLHNHLEFGLYFENIIMPQTLCTVLLTILVYKIYVAINKRLKRKAEGKEA